MKLLKLPEPPSSKNVSSLITIPFQNGTSFTNQVTEYLVTCSNECELDIWNIQDLQKASENMFDGTPQVVRTIGALPKKEHMKRYQDNSNIFKIVYSEEGDNITLFCVSDKNIYQFFDFGKLFSEDNLPSEPTNDVKCLLDMKDSKSNTIIDVQMAQERYLFVMLETTASSKDDQKKHLIRIYDAWQKNWLFDIDLHDIPVSFIVDPNLDYLTVFNLNKSVKFYRFKLALQHAEFYSKLHSIICNVHPIHYKVNMAPQGNFIPLINNVNNSKTGSTLICDFNSKFKIIDSIVAPSHSDFKIFKYSPKIFTKANKKKPDTFVNYNLIATTNSTNDSIMIWNTHRKKPLFQGDQITHSPSNSSISDIAWTTDGMSLFVSSKDGYISGLFFKREELGSFMDDLKFNEYAVSCRCKLPPLKRPISAKKSSTTSSQAQIKESSELSSTESSVGAEVKIVSSIGMKFNPPSYTVPKDLKRVAPTLVSLDESSVKEISTKSKKKVKKELESIDFLDTSLLNPAIAFSKVRLATPKTRLHFEFKFQNKYKINVANGNSTELKPTKISVSSMKYKESFSAQTDQKISTGFSLNTNASSDNQVTQESAPGSNFLGTASSSVDVPAISNAMDTPSSNQYTPGTPTFSLSSSTKSKTNATFPTELAHKSSTPNAVRPLFHHTHYIPKYVTICTGSARFFAFATDEGSVHIHSISSGLKLCPPLILGVPISFLESCGSYLSCVTSTGQVYCWDVMALKLKFPVMDIFPLLSPTLRYSDDILSRAENITSFSITNLGIPVVTLSNGDGYMYDEMMQSWILINDSWWAYGSQYWDLTNTQNEFGSALLDPSFMKGHSDNSTRQTTPKDEQSSNGVLKFLESKTNNELYRRGVVKLLQKFAKTMLMKEGFENLEEVVTLAHLENKILVLLRLKDLDEFENVMMVYCLRLGEMDYQNRLNEVFQWLYGENGEDVLIDAKVSKHELLKKILVSCADIRQIQRLTLSYIQALEMDI